MADKELEQRDKRFHESIPKKIMNQLVVLLLRAIALLPFWMIYGISDFFYVVVRYVIQYRKKVILENLRHSFPEKDEKEIHQIMVKFYRHFCDFSLETIKMHSMSEKQMEKRLTVNGLDMTYELAKAGKSIVLLGLHYNNWEWCSSIQSKAMHRLLMVVNPLRGNQAMERFISHSREKWGGVSVPVHKSARTAFEYIKRNKLSVLWLAADQTPPANSHFWTHFLNQETPFFSGPEKIAIKTNQPIVFVYVSKKSRGMYQANFTILFNEPAKASSNEILLTYIHKMEEIIRENPEYYLWSHRRWKHTRPEGIELIPPLQ